MKTYRYTINPATDRRLTFDVNRANLQILFYFIFVLYYYSLKHKTFKSIFNILFDFLYHFYFNEPIIFTTTCGGHS